MLELKNIVLKAGDQLLVKDPVSLMENGGQAIVFFGRNGTGKTTLLRVLAGRNGHGTYDVNIQGKKLKHTGIYDWSKLVCYISSHEVFSQAVNTYEYLLSARLGHASGLGLYSKTDLEVVEKWIDQLGLGPVVKKTYTYLSDGEKQLVSIARAFIYDTPVVLLDEPTSNLDVPNKKAITALLHKYAVSENKLIIYTSHDYFIAEKYCRQAWYIDHRQQFFSGDFKVLDEKIREDFGIL